MAYNVDLVAVSEHITRAGLWKKPLIEFETFEIRALCEAIAEAVSNDAVMTPPFIDKNECLRIPLNAPLKYRYWQGGQSILETLAELGASDEMKARHTPTGYGEGLSK